MIGTESKTHSSLIQTRLHHLRETMRQEGVGAVLVRSTDQYLNEYVPVEQSRRTYITGFTGSMGDALITLKSATLVVDGRYALQGKTECPDFNVRVVTLGQSIEEGWLEELAKLQGLEHPVLAVEADRVPVSLFGKIQKAAESAKLKVVTPQVALVEQVWQKLGPNRVQSPSKNWLVPRSITGSSIEERLKAAQPFLNDNQLDAMMIIPLDEIAWLSDIRSDELPYQATFCAQALALKGELWICVQKPDRFSFVKNPAIHFVDESNWSAKLRAHFSQKPCRVGLDMSSASQANLKMLEDNGAVVVPAASPFKAMKARKNDAELTHMKSAFARADRVVYKTQQWACKEVAAGRTITESDVDKKVRAEFYKSGAKGLSFKPICAAGKNGAVIHYGHPDDQASLKSGTLFLLDTGGLYEGGYATDLTRTFLLGDKSAQTTSLHKCVFTAVLKGAIAGMSARFPKGTNGAQLDAIVRDSIWRLGINFDHGTGHGVGINVHENPPRVSPGAYGPLETGHVFSIEPGLYIAGFGGVRIENLCTVVEDPRNAKFLCVQPLTFAPLDTRLIDQNMLTKHEKNFLKYYSSCFKMGSDAPLSLPPLDESLTPLLSPLLKQNGS